SVQQSLGHEAGRPIIDPPLAPGLLAAFVALAEVIARQRPPWRPGTLHGYHGISLGWYMGELVRRIDPHHRSLGRFFAEEIAGPLGLDVYFGIREETGIPNERIARVQRMHPLRALPQMRHLPG